VNYWGQYNLTVTGRVMVAKTFLLSQTTFMMGIIPLEKRTAKKIELLIEKFVLGKLQVARDRIYNRVEQGGLGLLKIWELNVAMKSSWINRWKKEGARIDITGSMVLGTAKGKKAELVDFNKIDKKRYPTAHCIASAWAEFREKVYENDGNLYMAQVFGNPGIKNRMGRPLGTGNILSRVRYGEVRGRMEEIRLIEIVTEMGIKEKADISALIGIELTDVEYGKLRDNVAFVRGKYKPVWEMREKGKSIGDWLNSIKKGSNKLRVLMSGRGSRRYRNFTFSDIRPIATLWDQMGLEIDDTVLACGMTLWTIREVDADFRQFMFRWNQGMVHGNTVVSHFGENVDRKCTFCKIRLRNRIRVEHDREPNQEEINTHAPDENRPHILWECQTVKECIESVYNKIWNKNGRVDKKSFLMGKITGFLETTQLYMLINMYIKYRIWMYKLAQAMPNANCIRNDVMKLMESLRCYNKWRIVMPLLMQMA
jgi:hypothetical protein